MDREEILKRSRAEKEDEGNTFAENRGRRAGFYGFACMLLLLLIFNYYAGQPSEGVFGAERTAGRGRPAEPGCLCAAGIMMTGGDK